MKCVSFFGRHDWSHWVGSFTSPRKLEDHEGFWRQELQRRHCLTCGYSQHEWLPTWQPEEIAAESEPLEDK